MRRFSIASALTALALVSGCTIAGNPQPQRYDLTSFDVGPYSVQPLEVPAETSEKHGRTLESARMTEALIDPVEADPALDKPTGTTALAALPTPAKVTTLLAAPVRAVLERNDMLSAAAVGGTDVTSGPRGPVVGESRVLTVLVTRFADAATALRAARDMDAADAAVNPENIAVTIPEYPAALAHWRPNVPTLAVTLPTDFYVISLLIGHTSPDLAALADLARKAFAAQLPRLRAFAPTPRERFVSMPLDPEGMLARMLPLAPSRWPYPTVTAVNHSEIAGWGGTLQPSGLVFGPRAAYLYLTRPRRTATEALAFNGFNVLARYPDAAAARASYDRSKRVQFESGLKETPGPAGVADVFCTENPAPDKLGVIKYTCWVLHGRYVATLFARESKSAQQRAAAQHGLLVNGG